CPDCRRSCFYISYSNHTQSPGEDQSSRDHSSAHVRSIPHRQYCHDTRRLEHGGSASFQSSHLVIIVCCLFSSSLVDLCHSTRQYPLYVVLVDVSAPHS